MLVSARKHQVIRDIYPADEQFVAATIRPAMETFSAGDLGGAFDRFMRGIGGPGYPAVLTGQLGPAGLEAARAESAFSFGGNLHLLRRSPARNSQMPRSRAGLTTARGRNSLKT